MPNELVEKVLSGDPMHSPKVILKNPIFTFNENDTFELSTYALDYVKQIEEILASEESYTQEDWKNALSNILDIQD